MAGFPEPVKEDWNKWTKGIDYVLKDPKGRHHFGKFLSEPGCADENHVTILALWERCDNLNNG